MATHPQDIPAIPQRGDKYGNTLFSAIGRALIAWEEVEVSIAHVYSALCNKSCFDENTNAQYGTPLNFNSRLRELKLVAEAYFISNSDQNKENIFYKICNDAEKISYRRNDIAHGVIRLLDLVKDPSKTLLGTLDSGWCLVPPHFKGVKYYDKDTPYAIYSSKSIRKIENYLWELKVEISSFAYSVELPRHALHRTFFLPPLEIPPYPDLVYTSKGLERQTQT